MFLLGILFMQLIGLGLSLEFIYKSRDTRFKYIIGGWSSWIIGTLLLLFFASPTFSDGTILILNSILNTLGTLLIVVGILHYSYKISLYRVIIPITILLVLIPFIIYFLTGFNSVFPLYISLLCSNIILVVLITLAYNYKKSLKVDIYGSLIWFSFTVLLSLIHMTLNLSDIIELFSNEDLFVHMFIIVSYIILLIHTEHNIQASEKFALKDSYSHSLGNILQIILSAQQLQKDIKTHVLSEKEREEMESLVEEKWNEASELLKEIREL